MESENESKEDVGDAPTKKACIAGLGSEVSPVFSYVSSLSGEAFVFGLYSFCDMYDIISMM